MTKAPTPTEMSKGKVTTQTTPQKSSIKQQLRTDLGRSVGVTTATQLVWLTGLRAHLPTPRNSRVIKRTHIKKLVNKPPYIDKKPTATPSGEVRSQTKVRSLTPKIGTITSNEEMEMIKSMEMHKSTNTCSSMLKFLDFVKILVFGLKFKFFTISENEICKK